MMTITIRGLPMSTKMENTRADPSCKPTMDQSSRDPRSIKKKSSRKSLRLVSRAPMESRKGVDARDTPARKAPTSLLNPITSLPAPSITAQAMANSVNSSREWASRFTRRGITYLMSRPTMTSMPRPLTAMPSMGR